jgi:hypothetical protein
MNARWLEDAVAGLILLVLAASFVVFAMRCSQ